MGRVILGGFVWLEVFYLVCLIGLEVFCCFFTSLHFQNWWLTILFCCLDFASQMDLFQRDSDNEEENEEFDETEVKWRKERFEREQWLREQVLVSC